MNRILFFSNNKNKISEVNKLFKQFSINLISLNDLGFSEAPKENGKTFAENAKIKSLFGFKNFNIPCFADDSGICISALQNKPGVLSRDFIESFSNNEECFEFIFKKVKNHKDNRAFFKTSICFTSRLNHHVIFEGKINGKISNKIAGKNGFGFDPIFIPQGFSNTFGNMSAKSKNRVSHRSVAITKLISFLING